MLDRRSVTRLFCTLAFITGTALPAAAQSRMETVASNSILADLVAQVGGERVNVAALVGAGVDSHVFQPSPADARRVAGARLFFVNGLGLEGWLPRLVQASGSKAQVITVSKGIKPIREGGSGHGHAHGHAHAHAPAPGPANGHQQGAGGGLDPHAWQDVAQVKTYVANIRDALIAADPEGSAAYTSRAAAYLRELETLDADIRQLVGAIPKNARRLITTHDAFGYFSRAYGVTFIAPRGVSTDADVSSRDIARIIRQIKAEKIKAVFIENISDARIMSQIAKETGAKIGDRIFSDALSDADGPAPNYIAMMRHNLRAFTQAMQP